MGYNVLSGSTSSISVISSGSFTGDGSGLENVEQFPLQNASVTLIPFYKTITGKLGLNANSGFSFSVNSNALTVPGLTSSVGMNLSSPTSGSLAGAGSYLGVDNNGNLIVTSSASGEGPENSVQIHTGGGLLTGSSEFLFTPDTSTLLVSGTMSMSGSLLPGDTGIHDLGSTTNRWNQIFVGTGSVHLGEHCSISTNEAFGTIHLNKPLSIDGGISAHRLQITSSFTASNSNYFIGVSASTAITVQMPSATILLDGQFFVVKDEGGNADLYNITVKTSGSQTIDGQSTIVLESPFSSVNLYSNGVDKYFIY